MTAVRQLCVVISALVISATEFSVAVAQCKGTEVRETELVGVGSDYARLTELSDTGRSTPRLARRLSNSLITSCSTGPWAGTVRYETQVSSVLGLAPFSVNGILNSAYPQDRNNGAMWAGRGNNAALTGGVILRIGPLTAAAIPTAWWAQNRDYLTLPAFPGRSPYSNGLYTSVDVPQRFGPTSYSTIDAGQSFMRLDVWRLGLGFSKENVWWGPGISNAILFTNTAAGFPHVFLNSHRALNVGIGSLTFETLWGKLTESKYFDTIPANDHRMVVGGIIVLSPRWVHGLYVGLGRTFVVPWDSVKGHDLFPLYQTFWKKNLVTPANPTGTSNDDQRVSIMGRYVLPESHFELYGEWAREDHAWNSSDFIEEPEHSAGHVIGFQKLFIPSERRWIRTYAEATNLQDLRASRPTVRTTPSFYTHKPQGHTELGQLLGASIGPGGESQLFGVDVLGRKGLLGGYLERVRRDEFSPRGIAAWSTTWPPRHDVAVTAGFRASRAIGSWRLDADLGHSQRLNRNFIRDETNFQIQLGLTWASVVIQP